MGVTSDVHSWWGESQMRVLVLSSLVLQFLLSLISLLRRHDMAGWFRSMMSLAFLGGDALAIYALATLFDRHKADQGRGGSRTLEVVWAPVLLAHLGGLHDVIAWNIEDNERWSGNLLTAVYQVTLAIYVFCKSWPGGDNNLLRAAILLFVYGGLKCFEKPWSVKKASYTSLVRSQAGERRARQREGQMGVVEYVKGAREFFEEEAQKAKKQGRGINNLRGEAYNLILDRSSPYDSRLQNLKGFWVLREEDKYDTVRQGLTGAFLQFYTRLKIIMRTKGTVDLEKTNGTFDRLKTMFFQSFTIVQVLPWAAIGLFHHSHREAYNDTDVNVTYALLCCTAVLEVSFINLITFRALTSEVAHLEDHEPRELWPEKVTQYSLIGYFSRYRNHSKLMWIASKFGCKDMVDQSWCMEPCFSSRGITELVHQYLKAGWEKKIQDVASYRSFNDNRGRWALEGNEHLCWSIKAPFDESVLLWHIATDLCFFSSLSSEHTCALDSETEGDAPAQETKCAACRAVQCRQMSNYMVYLLFVNPEMLLPGTRQNLFIEAYKELKDVLRDNKLNQQVVEKGVMETLTNALRHKSKKQDAEIGSEGHFIDDAWDLCQGLLKLRDDFGEEKMWEVIKGVWVEMLCFSASRCRGYLHAKALGSGGEFLSYVWLLLFYMGMETFTEGMKREREELPRPAPLSSDAHNGNSGASSPSHFHTGASTSSSEIHIVDVV